MQAICGWASPLPAQALDEGPAAAELFLQPLEPAVEMVDAVDDGLALRRKPGDHQRDRGAQIGRHDRSSLEPLDALDGRRLAVELDARAEPNQLLNMHESVLENGRGDA